MMARTPDTISAAVLDLCRQINPAATPSYIVITPEPDCEPNDCFQCTRRKVARDGGRIQFGWTIWEWPRVYVEAEHHAVYEPQGGGQWMDITPSAFPEIRRRLFLPDPSAVYDFENEGILRDNQRLALNDDPLIKEFFNAGARRVAIVNTIPGVGMVSMDITTAQTLESADQEITRLVYSLGMKYTPQNARCFCGSGEKFKRCHGQPVRGNR